MRRAKRIACAIHRTIPRFRVDQDDLIGAAYLGVAKAVKSFQPHRGLLEDHAERRARYEIMEYLRSEDFLTRRERSRARASNINVPHPIVPGELQLDNFRDQVDQSTRAQLMELWRFVQALPERERFVMTAYFWVGDTLPEIGARLGLSQSRIAQIKTRTTERLLKMATKQSFIIEPITRGDFEAKRQELAADGVELAGDSGEIDKDRVKLSFIYSEPELTITVLDKPLYYPAGKVESAIRDWFEGKSST